MDVIKNSNGKQYEILDIFEKYLLLRNMSWDGGFDKFLVAYNLYPNRTAWQHGNYFETLVQATKYFEEKQNEKGVLS